MGGRGMPLIGFGFALLMATGCGDASSGNPSTPLEFPPVPAGAPSAVVEQLERFSQQDPLQRAHAAAVLGNMGEEAGPAVPHLLAALDDPDRTVRRDAAAALGQIGAPQAVEPLIAILEDSDEDWGVLVRAAQALGKLQDRRATEPLTAALAYMVSHVRQAAATALGDLGDPAAVERLQSTARLDSDISVRYAAEEALAKIRQVDQGT